MKTNSEKFALVIQQYKTGQFKQSELALCHGVSGATFSDWIRKSGCSHGSLGRPAFEQPTAVQMRILRHAWRHKYAEVGVAFGKQRQSVWRLVKCWKTWTEREFGPRSVNGESQKNAKTIKTGPHTIQPNVISFRVSDSALAKISEVRGDRDQFLRRSLRFVARALLLSSLEPQPHVEIPEAEPKQPNQDTSCDVNEMAEDQQSFHI